MFKFLGPAPASESAPGHRDTTAEVRNTTHNPLVVDVNFILPKCLALLLKEAMKEPWLFKPSSRAVKPTCGSSDVNLAGGAGFPGRVLPIVRAPGASVS